MILNLAKSSEEILFLYKTRTHPMIDKMLSGSPPENFDNHLKYIKSVQEKSRWIFVAYHQDQMVGYSQIYDITDSSCEVGFAIDVSHQNRGYGKELVNQTILKSKELFPKLNIILYVLRSNLKAINIYYKMGFKEYELKNSSEKLMGMILS